MGHMAQFNGLWCNLFFANAINTDASVPEIGTGGSCEVDHEKNSVLKVAHRQALAHRCGPQACQHMLASVAQGSVANDVLLYSSFTP